MNKSTALTTVAGIAAVALMGALLVLGFWELLVYPSVIGGLILIWMIAEYRVKSNPNHPIGFLDHKDGMGFGIFFVGPAFLFLVGWTFYLFWHEDAIIRWAAYLIAAGSAPLFFSMNRIEKWIKGGFFERKGRNYVRRKKH